MEGPGRLKGHHVASHRTAVIIQNDREPRFPGLPLLIGEQHVQQGMVGLPEGIGRLRLTPVEEIEGLVIGLLPSCANVRRAGSRARTTA